MKFDGSPKKISFLARYLVIFAILTVVWACTPLQPKKPLPSAPVDFTLTLLHTNDTHSSYGGLTSKGLT